MSTIIRNGNDIINDNNFLFDAFESRLLMRLVHIFEKYKIPINKKIIKKNIEENLINNLKDVNSEIINKYLKLLENYESIIFKYVENRTRTDVIKKSTMSFVQKVEKKNKTFVTPSCSYNFMEYIKSIIFVYDNKNLNDEVLQRVSDDIKEIINEFNRNNYNFVIESINGIIKNIIRNIN